MPAINLHRRMRRPADVVVSAQGSPSDLKPAPSLAIRSMIRKRSSVERARRCHADIFHGEMAIGRLPVPEAGAGAAQLQPANQAIPPYRGVSFPPPTQSATIP
jgi:hypothetical protein